MKTNPNILKDVEFNMDKILSIFENMTKEYHNPTNFIANAEALIQSLRNFTFYLQSKKNSIANFDDWYLPWQNLMKASPYMRFIVDMRNSIVKQGINTAKSHVLIVMHADYKQTFVEKRMDIYSTTQEVKEEITELTKTQPILNHATAKVYRSYIFNYAKKDDLEVVDTLFYCTFFIKEVFEDFREFILNGHIQPELEKVIAPWVDVSDFAITFSVRDGSNLNQHIITVERDDAAIEEYKKQFGDIKLKHDINSADEVEQLRANIEYAQIQRRNFDELLPVLKYHSEKTKKWEARFPIFRNRAEKILFWEEFSHLVTNRSIDKLFFTVDAWYYKDLEKGMAAINSGKEINTLSDLEETLLAYYLDKSGKVIVASSGYTKDKEGNLVFKAVKIREDSPYNNAMFTAVFKVWGIEHNKDET